MENTLRTLKVRLVADITDYSGPMAAAQAQAAALKGQLATMFTGLGGMSAAGVTQLISPIDKLATRLNGISGQMNAAFRGITQGAATAQREVAALANTQARMMQDAVNAANQLRALPPPAASTGSVVHGPAVSPSGPLLSGSASASAAMGAASTIGQARTREMFPIGDSYEAQNPIWRMRQKGLEDAAYAQGPGSKAWADYQNARAAGGLKPAVWHDATKYLEDKTAAGGIAKQMQRMQDEGAAMAARSSGLPAVVGSSAVGGAAAPDLRAFAEAQAADAAADLERAIAIRAKREADRAYRKARRELADIEHKTAAVRPKGLQDTFTTDGHGLKSGPSSDKELYRVYRERIPAAQAAFDAAAAAKAAADEKYGQASGAARVARSDLQGFQKQAAEFDAARERALQVHRRQNDLGIEEQRKAESAHAQHLRNIEEEERLKARADHHEREREARETAARNAANDAERAALAAQEERLRAGGGGGRLPPGVGTVAAAAAGGGLPAVISGMADDAERVPGAFAKTRELWRELVAQSGGIRGAISSLLMGAGQGMIRRGNGMVQTGTRFSTRFSLPAGVAGGLLLKSGIDFQSAMSQVGVYAKDAGASAATIEKLSDRARELGRTTSFSATEVAQAMKEMLAAGLSVETVFAKIVPALERGKREQISISEFIDSEGLKGELREVGDLTEQLNKAELGTFKGQLEQLSGAFGELGIAMSKSGLLEFASNVAKGMTNLVDGLSEANPAMLAAASAGLGLIAVIGPSIVAAGSLIWGFGQLAVGISAAIGFLSGPVGWIALAGAAAIAAGVWASQNTTLAAPMREVEGLMSSINALSAEYVGASEERKKAIQEEARAQIENGQALLNSYRLQFANGGASAIRVVYGQEGVDRAVDAMSRAQIFLDSKRKDLGLAVSEPFREGGEAAADHAKTMAERLNYWLSKGIAPGVAASLAAAEAVSQAWADVASPTQFKTDLSKEFGDKPKAETEAERRRRMSAPYETKEYQDFLDRKIAESQDWKRMGRKDRDQQTFKWAQEFRPQDFGLEAKPTQFRTDTSAYFGDDEPSAQTLWDGVVAALGDMEHKLGAARDAKNPAMEKLEDLHGDAIQLLESVSNPMILTTAQAQGLVEEMNFLTTSFDAAASSATTFGEVLAERLTFWLSKGMDPAVAAAKAHAEAVSFAWKQTYEDVVGHSYVPDMVDKIGEHMNRLDEVAVAPNRAATSEISDLWKALGSDMDMVGGSIVDGLRGGLQGLLSGRGQNSADLLRGILGNIRSQTANGVTDSIFSSIGGMFKGWGGGGAGGGAGGGGGEWWQTALSWIGDLFAGGRANGGAVMPGRIYEVGEFGREKFIPQGPGYIANDNQWNALTGGGGGGGRGGGHYVDARITINGNVDSVTMPALQAALDNNNRMWAARIPGAVNATLLDNRRQQRRI